MNRVVLFLSLVVAVVMPGVVAGDELPIHFSSNEGRPADPSGHRIRVLMSTNGVRTADAATADGSLPEGDMLVECDKIDMGRSAQDAVHCRGDVVIRTSTFLVRADRLVSNGGRIVFTGDGRPVHFSGQPSKDIKLYVTIAAKRVAIDLHSNRAATIEP